MFIGGLTIIRHISGSGTLIRFLNFPTVLWFVYFISSWWQINDINPWSIHRKLLFLGLTCTKKESLCLWTTPKMKKKIFAEITKADHKLSKTFYFIKISYIYGLSYESFPILWCFLSKNKKDAKKGWFPAKCSCYGWKWHFLAKKHHLKYKNINNSDKAYDILIK